MGKLVDDRFLSHPPREHQGMTQTPEGARKQRAAKIGVSLEELKVREATTKHCYRCKTWKPFAEFSGDASRYDGLCPLCRTCRTATHKERYVPRHGKKGPKFGYKRKQESIDRWKATIAERGHPRLGVRHTPEARRAISEASRLRARRGPDSPSFRDGLTAERRGIRFSAEYHCWRYDVMLRDGFACRRCGDARGGNLCAHHILGFADHPDLRLVLANGLTLCGDCHKALHSGEWTALVPPELWANHG